MSCIANSSTLDGLDLVLISLILPTQKKIKLKAFNGGNIIAIFLQKGLSGVNDLISSNLDLIIN